MADLTKLKHMLDLQEPSFNMTAPENLYSDEDEVNPENDPMAFEPAVEEESSPNKSLGISQKDIETIQSLPLPEAQRSVRKSAMEDSDKMIDQEFAAAKPSELPAPDLVTPTPSPQETILKQLQAARASRDQGLNALQAGNVIAQAIASGSGAKIGDGSELVEAMRKQSDQPIKDYAMNIEDEENNPNSDISKFMREQAYATLKKLNPEKQYDLEKMSAAQLKKAMGKMLGSSSSAPMEWVATDRVTTDGTPVKFNRRTGEYMAGTRIIQPGEATPRDIARRDALTGNYGLAGPGGALVVKPTDYSSVDKTLKTSKTNPETGEAEVKNVKFSDFMKAAPEVSKDVTKLKEQYIKDMKEVRDNAAAAVTLASKLKPGANNEVDSGLLGGIQTQAAKLAGQKGVLTDQDLVKFAGAGGVGAKIQRILDGSLFGEMTDTDIKFFKRFSTLMNGSIDKIIENDSKFYIDQVKQVGEGFAPGFTDANAREWLAVDKVAPSAKESAKKDPNGDVVKIKGPSGQVVEMLKSKAKKYLDKAGYMLVD